MTDIREQFIIEKSENDDRQYRGIQLTNGLKVLLISDKAVKRCAAALAVGVGSSLDQLNVPGLMRLYQRILYLSDQFLNRRFRDIIKRMFGMFNAETQTEFATYYFDIHSSLFSTALSIFADLFKEFDLSENLIAKEICHVKRERLTGSTFGRKWNITNFIKWMRYYHETKEKIDKESKIETMEEKDIKELLKNIHELYCPSIMTLCVLGKEDLDSLEVTVKTLFTLEKKTIAYGVLVPCTLPPLPSSVYKICYVPHDAYNKLHIVFHLNYSKYHDCAIDRFLAYLFEYDGRGSLLWLLKAKDWGTSIEARTLDEIDKTLYSVCISLTENGVEHIDNIMTLFFQYVNMIKNNDLSGVYNEYKKIQEIKFRFPKEKQPSLPYVRLNAQAMLEWPMEYVLRGRHVPCSEWKEKSLKDALEGFLTPLRMTIYVASNQYETVTDSESPYYNYKIEEVPMETCAKWMKANRCTELNLPASNEFIPAKINIKPHEDKVEMFPQIIKKTEFLTVRHLRDMEFNEPKAIMFFHFISQYAYIDDIHTHYTFTFVNLINKSLSEYVYPAALVDLHWKIFATTKGIKFKISGLDNKQHIVLEKIIDRIMNFKINLEDFKKHQLDNERTCLKELEKFRKVVPWRQAKYYLSLLLIDHSWDEEAILKSCYSVTFEKFNKFISDFTKSMHVEGLIYGNITKAEALDITRIIEMKLSHVNSLKTHLLWYHDIILKNEYHFIFRKENEFDVFDLGSCTLVHYQIAKRSIKLDVLLDLTQKIINRFYRDTLEEKEQLGDMVIADVYRSNMIQGLSILVQGRDSHMHKIVEEKVDKFMHSMVDDIDKMPETRFNLIKREMIEYAEKPKTLYYLSDASWIEILEEEFVEKINVEIKEELDKIKLKDLRQFFRKLVNERTPKLSVYLTSVQNIHCEDESIFISRRFIENINDIKKFQSSNFVRPALGDIEKYWSSFDELDDNN